MLERVFYAWERRLAAVSDGDRVARPFEWGLEWLGAGDATGATPPQILEEWVEAAMTDSPGFYDAPPTSDYQLDGDWLRFPSAFASPHAENNIVHARLFRPARHATDWSRRAVLVLPQWNADEAGHVGLCRLLARVGLTALRLSLPYHDRRMPVELSRADYIVSANVARTAQVCRQAVLDSRRAIAWLHGAGYERIGILGTSLGSCLALLTLAHEPRLRTAALNHISPFFADVVWEGLSTAHVRRSLDGHLDLNALRRFWLPISPWPFLPRVRGRRVLLVYARYDLTFPVHLSRQLVEEFRRLHIDHELAVLPCGHYSTGIPPFSWLDALILVRFLRRNL